MQAPLFYTPTLDQQVFSLDEETSRHIVQVLRMQPGELVRLTNGAGDAAMASITDAHKKHCTVTVQSLMHHQPSLKKVTVAISLVKNASRFEWFLEKACEIGIAAVIPLICERTERQKFRMERMQQILKSAMLQSMQYRMPELSEPVSFRDCVETAAAPDRYIAHCLDEGRNVLSGLSPTSDESMILIGPEGDFSPAEIELGLHNRFLAVSLGDTRLRTETAGLYAAVLLQSRA